ncbi:MAG: hypothetical protein WA364_22575 [Candidatus Nitrosopolaris sp.]
MQNYNCKTEILAPHKVGDSVDWYEIKVVKNTSDIGKTVIQPAYSE